MCWSHSVTLLLTVNTMWVYGYIASFTLHMVRHVWWPCHCKQYLLLAGFRYWSTPSMCYTNRTNRTLWLQDLIHMCLLVLLLVSVEKKYKPSLGCSGGTTNMYSGFRSDGVIFYLTINPHYVSEYLWRLETTACSLYSVVTDRHGQAL